MSDKLYPFGKTVKLLVDLQGYSDGRLLQFEIWQKKSGDEKKVAEIFGVVKNNLGVGYWLPQGQEFESWLDSMPLQEQITSSVADEKFYFKAKIDDKEVKSDEFGFSYNLHVFLKDTADKPLDRVKCKVTFSDGQVKDAVFKEGSAHFSAAPAGKFKVELEGYNFVFK